MQYKENHTTVARTYTYISRGEEGKGGGRKPIFPPLASYIRLCRTIHKLQASRPPLDPWAIKGEWCKAGEGGGEAGLYRELLQ